MSWDYEPKSTGSGDGYLKIKDGESKTIRIVGETYYRRQARKGQELVDTRDLKEAEWEALETNSEFKISERFSWAVYCLNDDKAYAYEVGPSIFNQLKELAQSSWGDPRSFNVTIKRKGTELDTKYFVTPEKDDSPLDQEAISKVDEINLEKMLPGVVKLIDYVKSNAA